MKNNEWNLRRVVGAGIAALGIGITLLPSIAAADADLDAALRAYGARQISPQSPDPDPKPMPAPTPGLAASGGATPVMPAAALKSSPDGRPDLQAEAARVRQSLQRTREITDAALAGQVRGDFEARFNASLAGVKAWLGDPQADNSPLAPVEQTAADGK